MDAGTAWTPEAGVSVGFMARRGYYRENRERLLDELEASGTQRVALIVTIAQETFSSTRIFQDTEFTVTDRELESMIEGLQDRDIDVMLKPHLECLDGAWRGSITFPDDGDEIIQGRRTDYWSRWFASLEQSLEHYADLAERTGCWAFCLGCELEGAEPKGEYWTDVVETVRDVYDGQVVYNAHGATLDDGREWYRHLDAVGISYYYPAADEAGATVAEMRAAMEPSVEDVAATADELGVPVFFAETGCRSVEGGAIQPWDYKPERAYDGQEQANFLRAVLETFTDEPWFGGLFWWKWDENQDRPQYHQPGGDTGFEIRGKPAEDVLREFAEGSA